MLVLYIACLGALAFMTAYARNFQRTIVALGEALNQGAGPMLTPRAQGLRTIAVAAGWPLAFGIGVAFLAWWKAVVLVGGGFVLLVPVMGAFTPRSMSGHYLERIRADLVRRIDLGSPQAKNLRPLLAEIERISAHTA